MCHNLPVRQVTRRGPGRPPAAKAALTRQRIIRAAREVFGELGYQGATFQAIAARADLTRPAINHYFPSKRVLFREVVDQTVELSIGSGMARGQRETSFIGRMSAMISTAVDADFEDRSAATFLITAVLDAQRHPELQLVEHESLLISHAYMTSVVTEAVESGELSSDADPEALVHLLVSVMWGVGFFAGFLGTHEEMVVLADNLRRLLVGRLWTLNDVAGDVDHSSA